VNPEPLARGVVRGLEPPRYPEAPEGLLRLDANTNVLGVNPVVAEVLSNLKTLDWNQYPTPFSSALRDALAANLGLTPAHLVVGNGSDELFDILLRTFVDPGDPVAVAVPAFVMYGFFARLNLGRLHEVPLDADFQLDVDALARTGAKLTFIASPNNPTGNVMAEERIERLLAETRGIVVMDEAYAEFAGTDWIRRVDRHPNLVVTRTFSKAYGLAGLRVGYAAASPAIVALVHRVHPPFTVNVLSERVALAALERPDFMRRSVDLTRRGRDDLSARLGRRGMATLPTQANFVTARPGRPPGPWVRDLASAGVLIRDVSAFHGMDGYVRITVGTSEQHDRLCAVMDKLA
jgi:histidinol-phosphate aminotransferase